MTFLGTAAVAGAVFAAPTGPFPTAHATFKYPELDITDRGIEAVYPSGQGDAVFPVISYAHGFGDGGDSVMGHYSGAAHDTLEEMASWGYVVLAPRSCNDGCLGHCKLLPHDPPCFGTFYYEQLKTIDWARSPAAAAAGLPINGSLVGVAGHSMGGQATLFSAAYNASDYGIKAAALHHAYTHTYPAIPTVPHLVFTGTDDTTAPPAMAESIFNAAGAFPTRGLVNKVGAAHDEPGGGDGGTAFNRKLATFTAAWFKIFVDETPQWTAPNGTAYDFHEMIYGTGGDSLCGGGDGDMETCTLKT